MTNRAKAIAIFLAFAVPFVFFSVSFCMAQPHCACCHQPEDNQCSMQSSQDELAAVPDTNIEIALVPLFSVTIKDAAPRPYEAYTELDRTPLKDSLLCKFTHPSNGPPLT